jgi:uncharacterized protein YndB with AHSA1/START domain
MRYALRRDDPRLLRADQRIRPVAEAKNLLAPVHASCVVNVKRESAFEVFVYELARWWPRDYTFSGDKLALIGIEPVAGGRWFECDEDGREVAWGDVRAFDPGKRLVLTWAIGAQRQLEAPRHASEIEVRFRPEGWRQTLVSVEHRQFARHGYGAEKMREGMAGPLGWQFLLDCYAETVG